MIGIGSSVSSQQPHLLASVRDRIEAICSRNGTAALSRDDSDRLFYLHRMTAAKASLQLFEGNAVCRPFYFICFESIIGWNCCWHPSEMAWI
mgnify:CR=1 FL=1